MKRQHLVLYVAAATVLVIALAVFGVSGSTLFAGAFLLLCPLMMMFMMGGMHGGGMGPGADDAGSSGLDGLGSPAGKNGRDAS